MKRILSRLLPDRFRPIGYLEQLARKKTQKRVNSGPFLGMDYINRSQGSCYIPKLLGIYERELHDVIEDIKWYAPDLIVDVGAAEGYYAVGMARLLASVPVVAFELTEFGRSLISEMGKKNNVSDKLEIRGECNLEELALCLVNSSRPVIICDVEGYENELLDPQKVPKLVDALILVELHDCFVPGTYERLEERFRQTHSIKRIWQEDRQRSEFPWKTIGTRMLPQSYLDFSVSEWRPERMSWLCMVPKQYKHICSRD